MRATRAPERRPARTGLGLLVVLCSLLLTTGLALVGATTAATAAPSVAPAVAVPAASAAAPAPADPGGAATSVSAGGEYSCDVHVDGTLWCWGRNTYGQLGNGRFGPGTDVPQQVGRQSGWTSVSAGGSTTCATRRSHALFCWGLDHRGQLGDGDTHAVATPKRVPGAKDWAQVATAWFHTCGIRTDHSLWCWGDNSAGQLGRGTTTQDRRLHRVPGTWRSVSVAGWNTCGVRTDGSLWCWGRDLFGQLGIGSTADRSRPTQVGVSHTWAQVAVSWTHACGRTRNGVVRCWGRNDLGQVADPDRTYVNRPFVVPGGHVAISVAVAEGASCLVDTAHALWCWGDNRYGQVSPSAPVSPGQRTPVNRAGTATSVSGGWYHLCARDASGAAVCWGNDERGQLGQSGPSAPGTAARVPAPPARRDGPLTLRLASFNTLGNHHTQPGRDADNFAPARLRSDWEGQMILNQGIQVAGLQEQDAGQLTGILGAARGRLASFPTPSAGDLGVETTVVWDTTRFTAVKTQLIRVPFVARDLKRPVVELQDRATGRMFWVMAVHNAPNDYQAKRNAAVKIEIARLQELEKTGLPVFFVGDYNEKATVFCKVVGQTGLGSASGGRVTGQGRCVTPRAMRVDWIFGSRKQVRWGGFSFTKPPLARLSTDHFVPVVDVTVP